MYINTSLYQTKHPDNKIKDLITKGIKPDIVCLQNACCVSGNLKIVKYLSKKSKTRY